MEESQLFKVDLNLPDSKIFYYPHLLKAIEADFYFDILRKTVAWQQDSITLFGKTHPQPRLTALYGDKSYSYSGLTMHPKPFDTELLNLREKIKSVTQLEFNTCLLNLYGNGKDSNGWHADDEPELGKNPVIASLSLGQERPFHLKHRYNKELKHKILLGHGSLLLMQGSTQHNWLHQIPKTTRLINERINLTFRVIL